LCEVLLCFFLFYYSAKDAVKPMKKCLKIILKKAKKVLDFFESPC